MEEKDIQWERRTSYENRLSKIEVRVNTLEENDERKTQSIDKLNILLDRLDSKVEIFFNTISTTWKTIKIVSTLISVIIGAMYSLQYIDMPAPPSIVRQEK